MSAQMDRKATPECDASKPVDETVAKRPCKNRTQRLRAKKVERILEAAASASGEEAGSSSSTSVRGLPDGVEAEELSASDASAIRARLGFVPTNMLRVAARDPETTAPLVIELYPLKRCDAEEEARKSRRRGYAGRVQPWPTTFWLVDAALSTRLSKLELKGWVGNLERRLNDGDPDVLARADAVHDLAGQRRWEALTEADRALCDERGWRDALRGVGVAGMKQPRAIKCLHANYGFYLGTRDRAGLDGVVGKWSIVGEWIRDLLDAGRDADDDDGVDVDAPSNADLDFKRPGGRDRRWRREHNPTALQKP